MLESDAGSAFPPGSRVWGFTAYPSPGRRRELRMPASGAYAEQICVPEADVALMPASLSFEQAAALPLVATTAWQVGRTQTRVAALQHGMSQGMPGQTLQAASAPTR